MTTRGRTRLDRAVALFGAALIFATGTAFLAHDDPGGEAASAQPAADPSAAASNVAIRAFLYKPASFTVTAGTTVTFTNEDDAPHTATSGPAPDAAGVFDTGTLKKGRSKAVELSKRGTFAYYCAIHPFMKATVTVK